MARNGSIAFSSNRGDGTWAVYVTDATGTQTRRLDSVAAPDSLCDSPLRWTRNGRTLTFVGGEFGLRSFDTRTGRTVTLVPGFDSCEQFSTSPDGRELAYTDINSIKVRSRRGSVATLFGGSPDVSGGDVTWAPDRKHIAYIRTPSDGPPYRLEVTTPSGSSTRSVANDVTYDQPVWAPDARTLAYVGDSDSDSSGFVETIGADGKHRHRLSERRDGDIVVAWSPDSKQVAFSGSNHGTFVADANGSRPRRISNADASSISWSPDGTLIAYTAGTPEAAWLVHADGTHAHLLPIDLPHGGDVGVVSWDPAGVPVGAIAGTPIRIPRSQLGERTGPLVAFSVATGARLRAFPTVAGGSVSAIVDDGEGGWFVGGEFSHVAGVDCRMIAHVRADFHLDRRFCSRTNGDVTALARLGSTLYVGGYFNRLGGARRDSFGALDLGTAAATAWRPLHDYEFGLRSDEGPIGLAATAGSVYILGPFVEVDGVHRETLAAVNPLTGAVQAWAPRLPMIPVGAHSETVVSQVVAARAAVYIAGRFLFVDGRPRAGVAALDTSRGAPTPWAPARGDDLIGAIALDGNRLLVGGRFKRLAGKPRANLAAFDASTGGLLPWAPHQTMPVSLLAASPNTVWAASDASGQTRLAGYRASTGQPLTVRVTVRGGHAKAIAASTSTLVVGGDFDSAKLGQPAVSAVPAPSLRRQPPTVLAAPSGQVVLVAQTPHSVIWCETSRTSGERMHVVALPRGVDHPRAAGGLCPSADATMAVAGTRVAAGGLEDMHGGGVFYAVSVISGTRTRIVAEPTIEYGGPGDWYRGLASDGRSLFFATLRIDADDNFVLGSCPCRFSVTGGGIFRIVHGRAVRLQLPLASALAAGDGLLTLVEPAPSWRGDAADGSAFPRAAKNGQVEVLRTRDGRVISRFRPAGIVRAIAVSRRHVALVVSSDGAFRIESRDPTTGRLQRTVMLPGPVVSAPAGPYRSWEGANDDLSTSDDLAVALHGAHEIWVVDLITGRRLTFERTGGRVVGLSVVGRRVIWGEITHNGSRVLEVVLRKAHASPRH